MSTTTANERSTTIVSDLPAGAVGGIAGALVMGGLVMVMNPPTLAVAIPSLYALAPPPNPIIGMAVHAGHGAVLGLVFAAGLSAAGIDDPPKVLGLAAGWGVFTWVAFAALLMPVWLSAVGSPANPPFPNVAPPSLLWHLVYGLVLGGVLVALDGRL